MTGDDRRAAVLAAFAAQVGWCEALGSPFTAAVLRALADDVAAGGTAAALTAGWPGDPTADALPLRMAGALNALALGGDALAAAYPPHPAPPAERLAAALRDALDRHRDGIARFLASPPQTNEVGRSAVLLGGFLRVAAATGLPLRALEIGASAGLNTLWDGFHYSVGGRAWGDPASPVRLAPEWRGPPPPLDAPARVVERRACDVSPVDVADPEQRLRLRAYVWPDQPERLQRLDGALFLADRHGARVERADAGAWVRERLAEPAPGRATVLYHSIMWQYLPEDTKAEILGALAAAGERATPDAPLAWLRFEPMPGDARSTLRLTLWPGGAEERLAEAHPHGAQVDWLGA